MSVQVFPQKLLEKRKGQGTNLKTLEGVLAAIYTHSAPRSFSDPATQGLFARLLFLNAPVQLPSPHLWLREIFAPGISRAGILLPTGMDPSGLCGTFLFKKFHEDSHSAWNSGIQPSVGFACSAPILRVGSPGVPLNWFL